jgi:hypothetical protein
MSMFLNRRNLLFVGFALALAGCGKRNQLRQPRSMTGMGVAPDAQQVDGAKPRKIKRKHRKGAEVAKQAGRLVGKKRLSVSGTRFRYDCSGFVMAAHAAAGRQVEGSSAMLFDLAKSTGTLHRRKRPLLGDVVFFDNTFDKNKNGRRDDKLTHVAVVESLDGEDTATLVHLGSKGVVRMKMNLRHPRDHKHPDSGREANDFLRRRTGKKDKGGLLTGELFRAFGSLWSIPDHRLSALLCTDDGTAPS